MTPSAAPLAVLVRPLPFPTGPLRVSLNEVHIWDAGPDRPAVSLAELAAVLSVAERGRHERITHWAAADRFAHSRGLLRHLLAGYLDCRPADVPLVVTADGKPEVPSGPHFNLSHTAGRLLIAVAGVPVGVDVEPLRTVPAADDLVSRWFHPAEVEGYFALPADRRPIAFLRGWTCKEALLKGVGCGSRELAGCVVEVDPDRPPSVTLSPDGLPWQLACWEPDGVFVASVAVRTNRSLSKDLGPPR